MEIFATVKWQEESFVAVFASALPPTWREYFVFRPGLSDR